MGDKKEGDEEEGDPRFEFLYGYLTRSCKLRIDKWNKMIGNDDSKVQIIFRILSNFNLNLC